MVQHFSNELQWAFFAALSHFPLFMIISTVLIIKELSHRFDLLDTLSLYLSPSLSSACSTSVRLSFPAFFQILHLAVVPLCCSKVFLPLRLYYFLTSYCDKEKCPCRNFYTGRLGCLIIAELTKCIKKILPQK